MSRDILLNLIDPDPNQPRKHFDETKLQELAQSMGAKGLIVPILVRPAGERFVIIHGERRTRAAQALKWETISAEVRDVPPEEASWLSLIENVQRADLSPIEEARAYQALLAGGATQTLLGERIGKSQSYVATKLRFLNLPADVQNALDEERISEGHAKQLLRVSDDTYLIQLYRQTVKNEWSVKALNSEVNEVMAFLSAREAIAELQEEKPASDTELLLSIGCELPWTDYWPAEDFRYCGDRLVGVFARFMWLFGLHRVYADGFDSSGAVWFEMAHRSMRRHRVKDPLDADLFFVNLPARFSAEEAQAEVNEKTALVNNETVMIFRDERVEEPGTQPTRKPLEAELAVYDTGLPYGRILCTIARQEWLDENFGHLAATAQRTGQKPNIITITEDWIVASMSRDILSEHFQRIIQKRQD